MTTQTKREELNALADRLEREKPSIRLNEAIARAVGFNFMSLAEDDGPEALPRYTTSLDAAVTLVPEGLKWAVWHDGQARVRDNDFCGKSWETYDVRTPALALCSAALRARASLTDGEV